LIYRAWKIRVSLYCLLKIDGKYQAFDARYLTDNECGKVKYYNNNIEEIVKLKRFLNKCQIDESNMGIERN